MAIVKTLHYKFDENRFKYWRQRNFIKTNERRNLPYDNQPFARYHGREWISSFRHVVEHWNDEHIEQETTHVYVLRTICPLYHEKWTREIAGKKMLPSLVSMVCNRLPPSILGWRIIENETSSTTVRWRSDRERRVVTTTSAKGRERRHHSSFCPWAFNATQFRRMRLTTKSYITYSLQFLIAHRHADMYLFFAHFSVFATIKTKFMKLCKHKPPFLDYNFTGQ